MQIKTPKTQKFFKRETCGEINMFFMVFISLFRPVPTQWFHLITVVLALNKQLQIFSPLMDRGSPFGGFVSPFVGFASFCIWVCFIFFAEITVASGYWWIWLWVHNREKRKIEVLGFREFRYGFTILISPQPYQTLGFSKFFSKSSLYVGKLFFFFFEV